MSKRTPIIIVALVISIVATALTLFVSSQDTKMSCFKSDTFIGPNNPLLDEVRPPGSSSADSPPVYATVRGFPLQYYRQAFPADCTFDNGAPAPTNSRINVVNLVIDLAAWFGLALVVLYGIVRTRKKR